MSQLKINHNKKASSCWKMHLDWLQYGKLSSTYIDYGPSTSSTSIQALDEIPMSASVSMSLSNEIGRGDSCTKSKVPY